MIKEKQQKQQNIAWLALMYGNKHFSIQPEQKT